MEAQHTSTGRNYLRKLSRGCLRMWIPSNADGRHDDEPTDLDAEKFEQLYVEVVLRMVTRGAFRA
jgi:hypothetical protein